MRTLIVAASAFLLASAALAQSVGGSLPPQPRNPTRGGQEGTQHASEQEGTQIAVAAVTCRIGDVAVFGNRVHVRCSSSGQGADAMVVGAAANALHRGSQRGTAQSSLPTYYAVGLQSDPALASLTVSLATAAAAQNKQVQIRFNGGVGGNPPGCQPNDCRRLTGIVMLVMN